MKLTTEYWAYDRASDPQPINQYIVANERQMPELTTGGSKDADIAVPTIAFTPPIVMATTTAIPEANATTNPYARPITESKMIHESVKRKTSFISLSLLYLRLVQPFHCFDIRANTIPMKSNQSLILSKTRSIYRRLHF